MHIGFDISQTGSHKAGCGYYAQAMIESMLDLAPENKYSLFPSFGDFFFDPNVSKIENQNKLKLHYSPRHATLHASRDFWSAIDLEQRLAKPDIIHSNNFWCPVQLEFSRLFYTFHDMAFVVEPGWTTESNRIGCFDGVFKAAVCADWIVAVSNVSREHFLSVFKHFPEERVRVIHPCSRFADSSSLGKRPKSLMNIPEGKFWLSVGTIEPRKNQRKLIDAYSQYLAKGGIAMPLVLAGGKGWLMDDFQNYVDQKGISSLIVMTGYVSDEELIWLYNNCYANLYPSLFEGFGLPVLEGMQFGAPTVISNSTSLPEVTGDAAIKLSPDNNDEWTETLLRLAFDKGERDHLSEKATEQAKKFDWKRSAHQLLDLYQEAIALPKRKDLL